MAEKITTQLKFMFLSFIIHWKVLYLVLLFTLCAIVNVSSADDCKGLSCEHGICKDNNTKCECFDGWSPPSCTQCKGRMRLTEHEGVVTDGAGNYSTDNKCMWLIDPDPPRKPLLLNTHQFATECGWDHLYIFDGDSMFAPLIAAYSGLVMPDLNLNDSVTDIVAKSGQAYIYFYSDAAYNMSGFHIKYKVGECRKNCSGNGVCDYNTTMCVCNANYMGDLCEIEKCPNSCSGHGTCDSTHVCQCDGAYKGLDCSMSVGEQSWMRHQSINPPVGRASSASVLVADELCISGGYSFGATVDFLVSYNVTSREWINIVPDSTENPESLYGHSMVRYKDTLYIYGGVSGQHIESKLWMYNISTNMWTYQLFSNNDAVAGHTAVLVDNVIYILFGHSPRYGYMNRVQEIKIDGGAMNITTVETQGAMVKGGYGHTSIYHQQLQQIFVYGGYISGDQTSQYSLTDKLYSYNPHTKLWTMLARSGSPRYLHSAVLLGELMLVFGGNTHNDTSVSYGAKCHSADFMTYDPVCNSWTYVDKAELHPNYARYGHIAEAVSNLDGRDRMIVFGGFDGTMLNDILEYEPGNCSYYNNGTSCSVHPGRVCVCTHEGSMDRNTAIESSTTFNYSKQCKADEGAEKFCHKNTTSCGSCLSSAYNCKWCSNVCATNCTATDTVEATDIFDCYTNNSTTDLEVQEKCALRHNCPYCLVDPDCTWSSKYGCVKNTDKTSSQEDTCAKPCNIYNSCENCTDKNCMWCGSQKRCVETNSYVASFLYGQCLEWVTHNQKCANTRCSELHTCEDCKTHPECGWCNDASNTGLGKCISGSATAPVTLNTTSGEYEEDYSQCPADRWHFIKCPLCQCNGHSSCTNVSHVCDECRNLTEGEHCHMCKDGYYGNPKNGGNCAACSCNGQADTCDRRHGNCYCRTRGVKGEKCNMCDNDNNYFGDPNNGGTCYYDLRTDYQFTFNLSKPDDEHYTGINFMNMPVANDRDVDFTLNCSRAAYINITWKSRSQPQEHVLSQGYMCTYFRSKMQHKDFNFGPQDNVTFHVYVYGFETPFWLQISFSQFPKIDLVHFFVTFFSCFLSLLIIAAILYKIKHKYDNYRRRQRMIVELEVMASRPFAKILLEVDHSRDDPTVADKKDVNIDLRKRKRLSHKPGQIAQEPLHNQKAAIVSLFVQLPCGEADWAPSGQSGLAIGSTLVTLGHQRKQSVEYSQKDKSKHKKLTYGIHDTNV